MSDTPKEKYENERTAAFRATLDRLPDEIALAIGLRVFEPDSRNRCVCGWAIREAMCRVLNDEAERVEVDGGLPDGESYDREGSSITLDRCTAFFGGSREEWGRVFYDIVKPTDAPLIEEALFDRVMAAASASEAL